ncbi:MAG TPA: hypothetical protein VGM63_11310 [Mucilaginibacter sp.]
MPKDSRKSIRVTTAASSRLARTADPIMMPTETYEFSGFFDYGISIMVMYLKAIKREYIMASR